MNANKSFFHFLFCIGVQLINNVLTFQVNSEGTQPYIYMYPFSHIKILKKKKKELGFGKVKEKKD